MADSSRKRIWEGWESALACLLMALESDSWCIHPTALWTGDSLGWGWLEGCSLILPRASFLVALYFGDSNLHLAFLTDERQLSQSEAFRCHGWWLVPAWARCLFSICFLGALQSYFPSWSLPVKTAWGIRMSSILANGQSITSEPEARWTLCWAGWLSWRLVCLMPNLAT